MTFVHCWWDCENGGIASGEKSIKCSQKKKGLPNDLAVILLGRYPKESVQEIFARFVISKKDFALGPGKRIDPSRAFV